MPEFDGVIFDLDGTLLDTLSDLAASGNEMLAGRGFPPHPVEAYKTFIGDGMANLVARLFPENHRPDEAGLVEALAEYKAAYERHWKDETVPYPQIPELLNQLRDAKIPIAVLSNKAQAFTQKCVDEFLSAWQWKVVLGQRDGIPRKPDPVGAWEICERFDLPADQRVAFVGDSGVDMETAKNAGLTAIGVSWGFRSREELLEAGADRVIDSPLELL